MSNREADIQGPSRSTYHHREGELYSGSGVNGKNIQRGEMVKNGNDHIHRLPAQFIHYQYTFSLPFSPSLIIVNVY